MQEKYTQGKYTPEKNIEEKYTKKQIVTFVIILVVILGFFYYKNKTEDIVLTPDNFENPDKINLEDDFIKDENKNDTALEVTKNQENIVTDDSKKNFSQAIQNAQIAFGKGEYKESVTYYKEALSFIESDRAYSGLSITYGAQKDWINARIAIDKAIELNPLFTDHWIWKIQILDDKTNTSFIELKKIYTEGLSKVDPKTKVNLVTSFARIAENNKETLEAISLWEYAIELYPTNKDIFGQEIDRLKGL